MNIDNVTTALLVLNILLQHKHKDEKLLTDIIKTFSEDKEVIDFYTKHKLWKHVNFSMLNDLVEYSMVI